ncbi:MAG: Trp family transcriptional regulator [Microgenomates group bacterium]
MAQVSKKKINKNLEKKIYNLLYQVIADISNPKEAEEFLKDFLTEIELEIIAKRLGVAYYLNQNRDYDVIKNDLAVSTTTIATIKNQIKKKGFQLALKKIQADEWATRWAQKISKIVKFHQK